MKTPETEVNLQAQIDRALSEAAANISSIIMPEFQALVDEGLLPNMHGRVIAGLVS